MMNRSMAWFWWNCPEKNLAFKQVGWGKAWLGLRDSQFLPPHLWSQRGGACRPMDQLEIGCQLCSWGHHDASVIGEEFSTKMGWCLQSSVPVVGEGPDRWAGLLLLGWGLGPEWWGWSSHRVGAHRGPGIKSDSRPAPPLPSSRASCSQPVSLRSWSSH